MPVVSRCHATLIGVSALVLSCCTSFSQAAEASKSIKVTGSTTVEKVILEPSLARIRAATGIDLVLKCKGTGPGMIDLAKGNADASGASESLVEAVESANKAAKAKPETQAMELPKNLVFNELGRDRLAVIVNANNKLKKLDDKQLKEIFTGKITNWKNVGGDNKPIVLVLSQVGSATGALFRKAVLGNAEYATPSMTTQSGVVATEGGVVRAYSTADEPKVVQISPNAIAVVSESVVRKMSNIRVLQTSVIDRPLGLVTVGNPSPDVQKIIDYLHSNAGHAWEKE